MLRVRRVRVVERIDFVEPEQTDRDRLATHLSYDFDFRGRLHPPDPLPLRTDCFA